jgi:small subunit ribosomal protein S2
MIEQRLNDMGIFHYWQLAQLQPQDIERIEDELKIKGRVERDEWVAQAAKLAGGEE